MQAALLDTYAIQPPPTANSYVAKPHLVQDRVWREQAEVVCLVDQDPATQRELGSFLAGQNIGMVSFATASAYLQYVRSDAAACLILNMRQPDTTGLELQQQFLNGQHPPVIFVSDQCDIRFTVSAIKAGAIEFLTKPLDPAALQSAIREAFARDRSTRQKKAELARLQQLFALLTRREREVFPLVVGGLLNKQAAALLNISEVTLQIHRSQVMRKMEADSFADLVRIALKLRIPHWRQARNQPHNEGQPGPPVGAAGCAMPPAPLASSRARAATSTAMPGGMRCWR